MKKTVLIEVFLIAEITVQKIEASELCLSPLLIF
mgnify:CR=1 FL=1